MARYASLLLLAVGACADTDKPVDDSDVDSDVDTQVAVALGTHDPFTPPADPLQSHAVQGCEVFEETRCVGGTHATCALYAPVEGRFDDAPDALLRRAYLFDRWYDLYQSPDGQTAERSFVGATPPGTPEATWGADDHFANYDGLGDSGIWTGVSLDAAMYRYLSTGTEADYARFERKVRAMLTLFDVTGVPGYLARNHFLALPADGPRTPAHALRYGDVSGDTILPIPDPASVPDLPGAYLTGIPDGEGGFVQGTPMWQGDPSIDQYTGPMVSLPAAWGLVRDDALKERIATHLTCYLKRLQRIEIRNLRQRPDLVDAVVSALAGGLGDTTDPDVDLTGIDTIVGYALPEINQVTVGTVDRTCPAAIAMEPARVLDATSDGFVFDVLGLAQDATARDRATSLDHFYLPNVRGGDAVHLMHLAAMAWHMTGDPAYRDFLQDELLGHLDTTRVANTLAMLTLPRWCRAFYGDHITLPPLWALTTLLDDGPVRDELVRALLEEGWGKLASDLGNAKFALEAADVMAADDPRRATVQAEAMALLDRLGGNGGQLDDPRRMYTFTWDDVAGAVPGFAPRCPTEAERHLCEDGGTVLGITIPGEPITHTCTGAAGECVMADGLCATAEATDALPLDWRRYEDDAWQRDPFAVGYRAGIEGRTQSPGLDLTEVYWLARVRGATDRGAGRVLAWREDGSCAP